MMKYLLFLLSLSLLIAAPECMATPEHQYKEMKKPEVSSHRGAPKPISLNLNGDVSAVLWKPDLSFVSVDVVNKQVSLPKSDTDNYHALIATSNYNNVKSTVIRYIYRHGKPSGHSTSELTKINKTDLEITPDPVPREHSRYQSNEYWQFLIRFQGLPLIDHLVILTTDNGSKLQLLTDKHGKVNFLIPDDFPNMVDNVRDKRQQEMHIETSISQGEKTWVTRLDVDYAINPAHWQSTDWGTLVMALGFIAGAISIRFKKPVIRKVV